VLLLEMFNPPENGGKPLISRLDVVRQTRGQLPFTMAAELKKVPFKPLWWPGVMRPAGKAVGRQGEVLHLRRHRPLATLLLAIMILRAVVAQTGGQGQLEARGDGLLRLFAGGKGAIREIRFKPGDKVPIPGCGDRHAHQR